MQIVFIGYTHRPRGRVSSTSSAIESFSDKVELDTISLYAVNYYFWVMSSCADSIKVKNKTHTSNHSLIHWRHRIRSPFLSTWVVLSWVWWAGLNRVSFINPSRQATIQYGRICVGKRLETKRWIRGVFRDIQGLSFTRNINSARGDDNIPCVSYLIE